jgi:hypothetical protein
MKNIALLVSFMFVIGCSTAPIYLKHEKTGEVVQCGPYTVTDSSDDMVAAYRETQCIKDYQRQGYERVPNKQ